MTRTSALRLLAVAVALGAPLLGGTRPASARHAPAERAISGAIRTAPDSPVDLRLYAGTIAIRATTPDGKPVGHLRFLPPAKDADGRTILPYVIGDVPFDVGVTVCGGPAVAANPTPLPAGFSMSFQLRPVTVDPGALCYTITLNSRQPRATGRDFLYAPLEVLPALQQTVATPAPVPTPALPTPIASPGPPSVAARG